MYGVLLAVSTTTQQPDYRTDFPAYAEYVMTMTFLARATWSRASPALARLHRCRRAVRPDERAPGRAAGVRPVGVRQAGLLGDLRGGRLRPARHRRRLPRALHWSGWSLLTAIYDEGLLRRDRGGEPAAARRRRDPAGDGGLPPPAVATGASKAMPAASTTVFTSACSSRSRSSSRRPGSAWRSRARRPPRPRAERSRVGPSIMNGMPA